MTATAEIWNRANGTKVADLNTTVSGQDWAPVKIERTGKKLNAPGSGSITIPADHPAVDDLGDGNTLRLFDSGTLVHSFTLSRRLEVVTDDEDKKLVTCWGEGLMARWAEATVAPWLSGRPVSADRVWNFASPGLSETGWTAVYTQDWSASVWGDRTPERWPFGANFGYWIWSRATDPVQPAGTSLFRNRFTLADDATVVFYVAANSTFDFWVDGVLLESEPAKQPDTFGYMATWRYVVEMSAGNHVVAARVENWAGSVSDNPAGLICSAAEVTSSWTVDDTGIFGSAESSYNWVCKDYPSTFPGFTPIEILQELLDEAQARGVLTGWTIDDNSGSYDELEEFAVRVGDSYLKVLEQMSEYVDIQADDAGLVLNVWPKGDMGGASGVTVTAGTNLVYKSVEVDDEFYNAVSLVWQEGVETRTDATSISANGRRETSLRVPNVTNLRAVREIGDRFLDAWATPVESIVADVVPTTSNVLGVDAELGDTLTLDGDTVRVVGLTWTLEEDGTLRAKPELETLSALRQRQQQETLERLIAGFESPSTAPLLGRDLRITNGRVRSYEQTWSAAGNINDVLPTDPDGPWQPWRPESNMRLSGLRLEAGDSTTATGNTVATIFKNGGELNTLYRATITTSDGLDETHISAGEVITPSDKISVGIITAGGHSEVTATVLLAEPV